MNVNLMRVKPIVAELRRIADALEIIVREQYHIRMTVPKVTGTPSSEEDVLYSTDPEHFKQELLDIYHHNPLDRPIGDEEDDIDHFKEWRK